MKKTGLLCLLCGVMACAIDDPSPSGDLSNQLENHATADGVGHSTSFDSATEADRAGLSFVQHADHDFDADGYLDRVQCTNRTTPGGLRQPQVKVLSGRDGSRLHLWRAGGTGLPLNRPDNAEMTLTDCDVVEVKPGYPSIFVAMAYEHPDAGMRIRVRQVLLHMSLEQRNLIQKFIPVAGESYPFSSAARGVKCVRFPSQLVTAQRKHGSLCFVAGYDSNLADDPSDYGTQTALIKLEQGSGNAFNAIDLTNSSGLPWTEGMKGTPMDAFREIEMCNGSSKTDDLSMMDGAFLDYNRDGLPDLITVGQHASVKAHRMVADAQSTQGFRFETSFINDVDGGTMTEFLRVTAFNESHHEIDSTCLFLSGEVSDNNYDSCNAVPSHVRCYENGAWTTHSFSTDFSSGIHRPVILPNGDQHIIIKAPRIGGSDLYFKAADAFQPQIELSVANVTVSGSQRRIRGWACVPNTDWRPRIVIYVQKVGGGTLELGRIQNTDVAAGPALIHRCMQPTDTALRFDTLVAEASGPSRDDRYYVRADVDEFGSSIPRRVRSKPIP